MNFLIQMAPGLIKGSRRERINCALGIAAWFSMGAFVSSALSVYADRLVAADLSSPWMAVVGGVLVAVIASIKSA